MSRFAVSILLQFKQSLPENFTLFCSVNINSCPKNVWKKFTAKKKR